jgi:hypothetical protein
MMSGNISPQAALFELKRRRSQVSDDEFYDIICTFDTPFSTLHFLFVSDSWVLLLIYSDHTLLSAFLVGIWAFVDIEFDTIAC